MPTQDEFQSLVKQANDGVAGALEKLRECISEHPDIYRRVGDMSRVAIESLITAIAGENKMMTESLRCFVDEFRQGLLGESPTAIERIAVERVIVAHLEVNHLTAEYPLVGGGTIAQRTAMANQKNAAEKRLQNAMKSLVTLRSLMAQTRAIGNDRLRVVG
jgi:hypothetical protein